MTNRLQLLFFSRRAHGSPSSRMSWFRFGFESVFLTYACLECLTRMPLLGTRVVSNVLTKHRALFFKSLLGLLIHFLAECAADAAHRSDGIDP